MVCVIIVYRSRLRHEKPPFTKTEPGCLAPFAKGKHEGNEEATYCGE